MGLIRNAMIVFLMLISSAYAGETIKIDLPGQIVELVEPIAIKSANIFDDGGTISVVLADQTGKEFSFCLDGRLQQMSVWQALSKKTPPRHFYVNAAHPTIDGAQELPINGPEERTLLGILRKLMEKKYSKEEQKEILASRSDEKNHQDRLVLSILSAREK